jgi:hypothetical protein
MVIEQQTTTIIGGWCGWVGGPRATNAAVTQTTIPSQMIIASKAQTMSASSTKFLLTQNNFVI